MTYALVFGAGVNFSIAMMHAKYERFDTCSVLHIGSMLIGLLVAWGIK